MAGVFHCVIGVVTRAYYLFPQPINSMIIKLNVTHNLLKTTFIEIRFDTNDKILDVKDKIYKMTGTTPAS